MRRFLGLFFPSSRSALGRYTDKNVIAVGGSAVAQLLTIPIQMIASLASVSISVLVVTAFLVLFGVALAENFQQGLSIVVGAYNQGVAPVLNVFFEISLLFNSVLRILLPVYNFIVYIPTQFLIHVLMPLIWQYAETIPNIIGNASLAFIALVTALVDYVRNMSKCAGEGIELCANNSACGATFVEYDLNCFANPAFLSLDVMTSGVYVRRVMFDIQHVLTNSCATTALLMNVVLFPLVDFNFYKAVHCIVNVPLQGVVALVLGTLRRCEYLRATRATDVEVAVGCTPDFLPVFAMIAEALRALGRLVDNAMNNAVNLVLEILSGAQSTCAGWTVGATVQEAVQVFGTSPARVRVIGLTEKSIAITDGVSAMYRSGSHQAWAAYAWPFPVRVSNGIAAVQATLSTDGDDGDGRTGLLGCECIDTPDGIALACASVSLLGMGSDDDGTYNASTIHNINFDAVSTRRMTCARTMVRVLPMRFSRRRVSSSVGGGRDTHQRDPYSTFGAPQQTSPFTVDAAIYVQPRCGPTGSNCLPLPDACYPWCMGLHVAGLGAQNISIFNAVRWDSYVSVRQTDCGIELDNGLLVCDSGGVLIETLQDGHEQSARCGLETRMCVTNDLVVSSVPVAQYATGQHTLAAQKESTGPVSRHDGFQPFVTAGDVMLTVQTNAGGGDEVVVTRLYDAGNGRFGVGEELTLLRNKKRVAVTPCNTLDNRQCFSDTAQAGRIVTPISYFDYDSGFIPAAASEWAVHWAVNPELRVMSALYDFCHNKVATTTVIVGSSWSPIRVWTMKTMRANDLFATGDESAVAYMLVPGFQDASELSCTQVSSIRVVAVEYLNTYNVLVTVLEAAPRDVDPAIGDVCETCVKRYRHFYLNPERHDCVEPLEGQGAHFTCWREDQQWSAPEDTVVFGQTCPAAERMPPIGSAAAEIACITVWLVRLVLDTLCVIPATIKGGGWGGLSEVMQPRLGRPTFHSILDTSGANFLNVEEIIRSINRASLFGSLSLTRLADAFRGRPGSGFVRNMLTGTAKILQHSDGLVVLGDPVSKQLEAIRNLPSVVTLESMGSGTTNAAMPLPMGMASTTKLFITYSSVLSLNLRVIRRMLVRLCRATSVIDAASGVFLAAVYESKNDFDTFLDNSRMQCHGLGDILGGTNPWARMVRQACQLGPESVEFVLRAARVMFVEYVSMSCVCGLSEGARIDTTTVSSICLQRFSPAVQQRWMLELVFTPDNVARRDLCFAAMDTANGRLLGAMDPFLQRTFRLAENMADGLDHLITAFTVDRSGCDAYLLSPYVLSLVPEPVDFFMGCMHTFDCRAKCLTEYGAFEQALVEFTLNGVNPVFDKKISVDIESNLFDPYAIENNENLPPFELFAVLELDVCQQLCSGRVPGRCIAVAGRNTGGVVGLAYYCLPADVTMFVFEYAAPGPALLMATETVVEMMILTGYKVTRGGREWVLVIEEDDEHTRALISTPDSDFRTQLFASADVGEDFRLGFVQVVTTIRVIPAMMPDDDAHVFVLGKRNEGMNTWSSVCLHFVVSTFETTDALAPADVTGRECKSDAVISPVQRSVCLDRVCSRELILPATINAPSTVTRRTWTGLENFATYSDEVYAVSGKSADVAMTLGASVMRPIYQIEGRAVARRTILSPMTFDDISHSKYELIACNVGGRQESWINVVHLKLDTGKASAFKSHTTTARQEINFQLECSIDTCVGCNADAELEAKCYAAQECGVARCAGSIVNMRKPMCSIGKLAAQNMHLFRIALGGMWQAIAQQIVLFVELSEARRTQYEISWPEEAFVAATCQAKDVAVQLSAVFTSLAGAISLAERKKQETEISQRHAAVDSRVHARYIMTVTSATHLMASIMLFPVYGLLATRKLVSCSVNDAIAVFTSAVSGSDASVSLFFGSKKLNQVAQSVHGVCLGFAEKQELRDVARTEHSIVLGMANLITGIGEMAVRVPLQAAEGVIDAVLSYLIGIVTGIQDLLATVDWQSCKLPVVGASMSGSCVCGDTPHKIPESRRIENAQDGAFWCSGLMLLTAVDGSDLLIWNPYSLEQLLDTPGLDSFVQCLADTTTTRCDAPTLPPFVQQGVELLQVITRCRHNYQRSRWDDAAVLYSLFAPREWRQGRLQVSSAVTDDEYTRYRLRMRALSSTFAPTRVNIADSTWNCLALALKHSDTFHRCQEIDVGSRDAHFTYEPAPSTAFKYIDACRVYTGAAEAHSPSGASNIPYMWSARSENKVPVATLHRVFEIDSRRIGDAESQLRDIVEDIRTVFRKISPERLEVDLKASAFSVEGDQMHQLVDCIVIGPYAAAAVPPSAGPDTSMYYRSNPDSRLFESSDAGHTGGSAFRKRVMTAVADEIAQDALPALVQAAKDNVERVRRIFLGTDDSDIPTNLLCTCANGGASLACCADYDSVEDIDFGARNFFDDAFVNLQTNVMEGLLDRLVDGELLSRDIWTSPEFAPPRKPISSADRDELQWLQIFNNTHGAHTYGRDDVRDTSGGKTLWLECMEQLSTPFFTMPLKPDNSVDADLTYDPLTEEPGEYQHAIERAVQKALKRAREESPVFWSHVHRYVPSNSVWCESSKPLASASSPNYATPPSTFMDSPVSNDKVVAPTLAQTKFPADALAHCFCGWTSDDSCYVTELGCKPPVGSPAISSALTQICNRDRTYSSREDLIVVIDALRNRKDLHDCDTALPSTLMGLLDTEQTYAWFADESQTWSIDMEKIATKGPAGIRLAHVGTDDNSLWNHAHTNSTGVYGANTAMNHTVGQPVCRQNLNDELKQDLSAYFRDVFFPMAHSVHEPPVKAACSRWVIEYALLVAIAQIPDYDLIEQTTVTEVWRARCGAQLQQVGACQLRGVFDIFPPEAKDVYPGCPTVVKSSANCAPFFHTPNCLVRCGKKFFDPCLCNADAECKFTSGACDDGHIDIDAFYGSEQVRLLGMHWPASFPEHETEGIDTSALPDTESLKTKLDFATLHTSLAEALKTPRYKTDGDQPHAFCDDLLDYWDPDAQHPMGYHPTMACTDAETNMRGFDSWMSASKDGVWAVDPERMRDPDLASAAFGASSLVCDAAVYGADAVYFNDIYLNSRWHDDAHADPTVPGEASAWDERAGDIQGIPSRDSHDTPLVKPSDTLLTHTTGLVRDWMIAASGDTWPHWEPVAKNNATYTGHDHYASSQKDPVCAPPSIKRCYSHTDCIGGSDMLCRLNGGIGVCMHKDTCSQHTHCPGATMCAGDGRCVEPAVTVTNSHFADIAVQTHARACDKTNPSSHFQNVPNFMRAAGLCKFRNWFQMQQVQARPGTISHPLLLMPADTTVLLSEETSDPRIDEWLRLAPHVCDRSYHRQLKYNLCPATPASAVDVVTGNPSQPYKVFSLFDEKGNVRTCNLRSFTETTGFLDPYTNTIDGQDSLMMIPRTVRRCSEFQTCPKPVHRIEGQTVQRRRVLIANTFGERTNRTRQHCAYDVERCWGAGYVVGPSCSEAIAATETVCVVDLFVVPMLWVVFGTDNPTTLIARSNLAPRLEVLQSHCTAAFDDTYMSPIQRFGEFYNTLALPFRANQMEVVAEFSTHLFLSVFGVTEYNSIEFQESFIDEYMKRKKCAEYVMERLKTLQAMWVDAYTYEPAQTGVRSLVPGTSLYLIYNRIPVYVSFSWMWKCGILHGAGERWLQSIPHDIECKTTPRTDKTSQGVTVQDRMTYDDALYTKDETDTVFADQVMHDLDHLIHLAIYQLGVGDCTDPIKRYARQTLLSKDGDLEGDWYRWTVDHMIAANILEKRSPTQTLVSKYTNDFPYVRFKVLNYEKLTDTLYFDPKTAPDVALNECTLPVDEDNLPKFKIEDWCNFIFADGCVFHHDFFTALKQKTVMVQAVNFVLLFIERNMHLLPSFAGDEFNIKYDNRATQTFREVSVVSNNIKPMSLGLDPEEFKQALIDAADYDTFMADKGYECRENDIDLKSSTSLLHQRLGDCVDAMQDDGGWVVPQYKTVRISSSKDILTQGFFISFTETGTDDLWLSDIFSLRTSDLNSANDAICYLSSLKPEVMNPYWAGDFDFETGCDTSTADGIRYFDVRCRERRLGKDALFEAGEIPGCFEKFKDYANAVKTKMLPVCVDNDRARQTLLRLNMGSLFSDQVPLCSRKPPTNTICDRAHGTFHNYKGTDIPTLDPVDALIHNQEGVWNHGNVIMRGVRSNVETLLALQVRSTDIAGHSILFKHSHTGGLRLECLNLASMHEPRCERTVVAWLSDVEGQWQQQHRFILDRWPTTRRRDVSWHCPLQWLTAYAGLGVSFSATSPSRERNVARFAHITGDAFYAHPTVGSVAPVANLHAARFMSEFQACSTLDAKCHGSAKLKDTIERLRNVGEWHEVQFITDACDRILDWPHETFTLRDRQAPNNQDTASCNVYNRLPRFTIALQRGSVRRAPSISTSPGGACHMGRLLRLGDPDSTATLERCARRDGVIRCLEVRDSKRSVVDFPPTPAHTSRAMDRTQRPTRQRQCRVCTAGQADERYVGNRGPHRTLPETPRSMLSTGEQIALSTERVLSAEVRRRVCGANVTCPRLNEIYDMHKWSTGSFLHNFLEGRALARQDREWTTPPPAAGNASTPTPDEVVWARPWVFCTTVNTSTRCSGTIPRETWADPVHRREACGTAIKSSKLHSRNTRIVFCLLNSDTQELCQKMVMWRDNVHTILCQAAGVCPKSAFFYTPTAYDVNNQEFARDTVRKFYQGIGTECPDPSPPAQDQIDSNNALLDRCAASSMERVRTVLYGLRMIKELVVRIMYYYSMCILHVLNLFVAAVTIQADLMKQSAEMLIRYVLKLLEAITQIITQLFAAMAKAIFGGGRMEVILDIIIELCRVVQWIYRNIIQKILCFIIFVVGQILDIAGDILIKIGFLVKEAKHAGIELLKLSHQMKNSDFCSTEVDFGCDDLLPDEDDTATGTLRAPTRCWATYVTFFGDTEQLSCTTADTCKTSLVDSTLVTCAACPAPGHTRRDFGCSSVTKQCTCDVPSLAQTACTSNAACDPSLTSATCQYVDDEIEPSTGFIECATCQQTPFCLVSAGEVSGVCSCSVFDSQFASCSAQDYGSAFSPPFGRPCLYTRDPKYSRARDFKIDFAQVLTARCQDLSIAYCMRVEDLDTYWVVGVTTSGRRLLGQSAGTKPLSTSRDPVCLDAATFGMVHTAHACAKACTHSRESVKFIGLTAKLEPCAFGSVEDFSYAMRTHPLLVADMISRPDIWLEMLVRHSPLHTLANSTARAFHVLQRLAVVDDLASVLTFNRSAHGSVRITTTNPKIVPAGAAHAIQVAYALAEMLASYSVSHLQNTSLPSSTPRAPSRRLLFAEVGTAIEKALTEFDGLRESYATQVADIFSYRYADVDKSETRQAWLYDLRPNAAAAFLNSPCQVFTDTLTLVHTSAVGLEKSFTGKELQATPAASLAAAWTLVTPKPIENARPRTNSNFIVDSIVGACQALGVSPAMIYAAMQALVNELRFSVRCDYIAMQTCSKWRIHIMHGTIIVGIWFAAWFVFCGVLNLGFVATLTIPLFGIAVMTLSYGYSFQCVPIIPVCLFEDMHAALRVIFPRQMSIPRVLLLDNSACQTMAESPPAQCIRTCAESPLTYNTWYAPAAWVLAELNVDDVQWLAWLPAVDHEAFAIELRLRASVLADIDQELITANRLCALSATHLLVPYLLIAALLFIFVSALFRSLAALLTAGVLTIGALMASASTPDDETN